MDFELFVKSLQDKDFNLFKKIKKTNLHNHALLSANQNIFYKHFKRKIPDFIKATNISSFNDFVNINLIDLIRNKKTQFELYELSILTAIESGITIFDMCVDYKTVYKLFDNSISNYVKEIQKLKKKYSKKIILHVDLGISRNSYKKEDYKLIKQLIDTREFNGIDLYGDELSKDIRVFKKIYRYAKKKKLILKAHVGEFGNANSIKRAIKVLKLNMVQHGISIVNNKNVIKYAKKKKVIFNVSITSNILLSRVNDVKNHPIRKMFDSGLIVTINTDDELIFNSSLFNEFVLLYENNIFNCRELYKIIQNGLNIYI